MIYLLLIVIAAMAIYIVNIQVSFYQYKKNA